MKLKLQKLIFGIGILVAFAIVAIIPNHVFTNPNTVVQDGCHKDCAAGDFVSLGTRGSTQCSTCYWVECSAVAPGCGYGDPHNDQCSGWAGCITLPD